MINPPLPTIDADRIWPAIGERFPDVVLPDQHGRAMDLHEHRGGRPGLFVVLRSAAW